MKQAVIGLFIVVVGEALLALLKRYPQSANETMGEATGPSWTR